jgi:hypothetical protein
VHTVKYDIALLGLVGVALDIFDCGQATHNSSVCEQQSKKMRMLLVRLLLLSEIFGLAAFSVIILHYFGCFKYLSSQSGFLLSLC